MAARPVSATGMASEAAPEAALFCGVLLPELPVELPVLPAETGEVAADWTLLMVEVLPAAAEAEAPDEVGSADDDDDELCAWLTARRPWLMVLAVEHWLLAGAGWADGVAASP